jgi:hypothetical protein
MGKHLNKWTGLVIFLVFLSYLTNRGGGAIFWNDSLLLIIIGATATGKRKGLLLGWRKRWTSRLLHTGGIEKSAGKSGQDNDASAEKISWGERAVVARYKVETKYFWLLDGWWPIMEALRQRTVAVGETGASRPFFHTPAPGSRNFHCNDKSFSLNETLFS